MVTHFLVEHFLTLSFSCFKARSVFLGQRVCFGFMSRFGILFQLFRGDFYRT